jgi:hypothetical protein
MCTSLVFWPSTIYHHISYALWMSEADFVLPKGIVMLTGEEDRQ